MISLKESAGLLIIQDNKILLGHPTSHSWYGSYSIPKGEIEPDESKIEAAIRETYEEVGLLFDIKDVNPTEYCIDYIDQKTNKLYKKVYYFIVHAENIPDKLPKNTTL